MVARLAIVSKDEDGERGGDGEEVGEEQAPEVVLVLRQGGRALCGAAAATARRLSR